MVLDELGRVGIGKGRIAGCAAPALDTVLTVVTEPLGGSVITSDAGHGRSPLAFCGESRQNLFGSGLRLTPRFGLAPTTVRAAAGAFNQQLVVWRGARHRFLPAFLKRSALLQQGVSYLTPKSFLVVHPETCSKATFLG